MFWGVTQSTHIISHCRNTFFSYFQAPRLYGTFPWHKHYKPEWFMHHCLNSLQRSLKVMAAPICMVENTCTDMLLIQKVLEHANTCSCIVEDRMSPMGCTLTCKYLIDVSCESYRLNPWYHQNEPVPHITCLLPNGPKSPKWSQMSPARRPKASYGSTRFPSLAGNQQKERDHAK